MALDSNHDRTLVAAPTYRGKSYSLEAYIRAYNDFSYPNKGLFMVDTTGDGLDYFEHLKKIEVPCDHINPGRDWQETFARAWKRITREAVDGGYQWVASIEADNICPPLTLDALLNIAGFCRAVHVAHGYPWHSDQSTTASLIGLGCNVIHVDLLKTIFEQEKWMTDAFESEVYEYPKAHGMPCVEVYNVLDIRHFDAPPGYEYYMFDRDDIPAFTKGQTSEGKPYVYTNAPPKFNLNV